MSFKKYVFLFFFIILICSSCSKKNTSQNIINLRLNDNPGTLDPAKIVDVTQGELAAKIFSGLVRFDENFEIVPDLCEKYTISDNGQKLSFSLKNKLTFSDNSPLTSKDVLFSFKRVLARQTACPRKWVLEEIRGAVSFHKGETSILEGFKIVDDYNFEIFLEKPFAPFLSLLTMPTASILPSSKYSDESFDAIRNPIGAGPYKLVSWEQDSTILFEPNPNYHDKNSSRPSLLYKIIPEDASAIAMLSTGELDIIKIPRRQVDFLKGTLDEFHFMKTEELNTYFLGFDHRKKHIDRTLKEKIASIINSDIIIKSILGGQAQKAISPVPPALLSREIKKYTIHKYLNANERTLSKDYKLNKKLKFLIPSGKEVISIAVIIQDQLKKGGVDCDLISYDWSAFKDAIINEEADIFFLSWWGDYADAENFLFPTFHSENHGANGNRVYYTNPEMDVLLKNFQGTFDYVKKDEFLKQILNEFYKDLPWVPLWHRISVYAVSNKIEGFKPVPIYSMDKGLDIKIRKL